MNAENFAEILEKSLPKASNLLASKNSLQAKMFSLFNLYQIFAYVKNKDAELRETEHEVSGMLLYARTDEEIQPDIEYRMSGNRISMRTLDLNREFGEIADQLKRFVLEYFGE